MMNWLRRNMKYILGLVALSFILTIIFSWGMGGFKNKRYKAEQGIIGVIDGQKIQYQHFQYVLEQQYEQMKQQTKVDDLPDYQKKSIRDRVWNELVTQILISKEIKRLNIGVTPQEVVYELKNNPPQVIQNSEQFQTDGKFDINKYHRMLNNKAYYDQWIPFENDIAVKLPMQKIQQWILSKVRVTDAEVEQDYKEENTKVDANYILYSPASMPLESNDVTDAEIEKYYKKHKEDYIQGEQRKIEYILLEPKMSKEDSLQVEDDAKYILTELKNGADFAELAETYSDDAGTKNKGGDLGFFGRGEMVKPFEDAAFSAHVGDIVGPVKSQFGLHIIKIIARKVEKGELKIHARHILLKYEVDQNNYDRIYEQADYIAGQLEQSKGKNFKELADQEKLELKTSDWISREGMIPGVGLVQRINFYIFSEKRGWTSKPMYAGRNVIVFKIVDILKKHTRPMDEVKDDIKSKIQSEKRNEMAQNKCKSAWQKIKGGLTLAEVAAEDSLTVLETKPFNLDGYINRIGRDVQFAGTAFRLGLNEISEPVKGNRGYFLIQVIEKQEPDMNAFQSLKKSRKQALFQKKQQEYFTAWIDNLKSKADIQDYRVQYY